MAIRVDGTIDWYHLVYSLFLPESTFVDSFSNLSTSSTVSVSSTPINFFNPKKMTVSKVHHMHHVDFYRRKCRCSKPDMFHTVALTEGTISSDFQEQRKSGGGLFASRIDGRQYMTEDKIESLYLSHMIEANAEPSIQELLYIGIDSRVPPIPTTCIYSSSRTCQIC